LRVATLHYHYKPGGVTRVVENAAQALEETMPDLEAATLGGTGAHATVQGLDYTTGAPLHNSQILAADLQTAASNVLGGAPDIWHIHNHNLGKHPAFCATVDKLAVNGAAILLHIHDFAEDGRPNNYRRIRDGEDSTAKLYPCASHIHYAALNRRDLNFLKKLGVPEDNLHSLPNPVHAPRFPDSQPNLKIPGDRLYLYPVRAVRRKNLGELALWAALAQDGEFFASSLGPTNADELPAFQQWQALAKELKLPLELGINNRLDATFSQLAASSDTMLTTSLAEGFGLAFLEPWALGKPLAGRDLPEITGDFKHHGILLDHLYERLDTPLDWLDLDEFEAKLQAALHAYYQQYGKPPPEDALQSTLASMIKDDAIDYGRLNEADQARILCKARANRSALPSLPSTLPDPMTQARQISQHYNLRRYGAKLAGIYAKTADSKRSPVTYLDPDLLLDQFLDPARFCFLRT